MTATNRLRRSRLNWQRRAIAAEAELAAIKLHTYAVERITLSGTEFHGCDSRNPDYCSCATWTPIQCVVCGEDLGDGDEAFRHYDATPWFAENEPGRWDAHHWHIACDGGVNTGQGDEPAYLTSPVSTEEVPF